MVKLGGDAENVKVLLAAEFQLVVNPVKQVMLSTQGQLMTETLSTNSRLETVGTAVLEPLAGTKIVKIFGRNLFLHLRDPCFGISYDKY